MHTNSISTSRCFIQGCDIIIILHVQIHALKLAFKSIYLKYITLHINTLNTLTYNNNINNTKTKMNINNAI